MPPGKNAEERKAALRVSVTGDHEGADPGAERLFGLAVDLNFLPGFGKIVPSKCVGKVELRTREGFILERAKRTN